MKIITSLKITSLWNRLKNLFWNWLLRNRNLFLAKCNLAFVYPENPARYFTPSMYYLHGFQGSWTQYKNVLKNIDDCKQL